MHMMGQKQDNVQTEMKQEHFLNLKPEEGWRYKQAKKGREKKKKEGRGR